MLTRKQKDIYSIIAAAIQKHGYSPSVRDIARAAGLSSPATIHTYIKKLIDEGLIVRRSGRLELVQEEARERSIPLVGLVPAGNPAEMFDYMGDEIDVPTWLIGTGSGRFAALRAIGDSMKDAYIGSGDIIVIELTDTAASGEMVVAALDDHDITLKRLKIIDNQFWLIPENPDYKPLVRDHIRIIGKVRAILRRY
jgi:repressor LexA